MEKESVIDNLLLIAFWVLFLGVPWLVVKTNKGLKDTLDRRKPLGCCCLLLVLFVWFCILAVISAMVFYYRYGRPPG